MGDRGRGQMPVQSQLLPAPNPVPFLSPPQQSGGKSFYRQREGLHAETAQSVLTVILKSVIGGLINIILIVLSTVNLHFQGCFVSISLRPVL